MAHTYEEYKDNVCRLLDSKWKNDRKRIIKSACVEVGETKTIKTFEDALTSVGIRPNTYYPKQFKDKWESGETFEVKAGTSLPIKGQLVIGGTTLKCDPNKLEKKKDEILKIADNLNMMSLLGCYEKEEKEEEE